MAIFDGKPGVGVMVGVMVGATVAVGDGMGVSVGISSIKSSLAMPHPDSNNSGISITAINI
ncbi:MAG TPA: hypothetical protein G4N92_00685 [Anaerolineae bacterium]|nr:hypothetical protein [Anaerolineae bacterium]